MKSFFLSFGLLLGFGFAFAQPNQGPVGHLTIFSEDGDKFTLILNGEQINDEPQSNLRVEDLNQPYYSAKIKFQDNGIAEIVKKNLMITDADGIFNDVTYKIRRDKNSKSKAKLNYFSSIPVRPDFIPPSNTYVVHYGQPQRTQQLVLQQTNGGGVRQTTTTQTSGAVIGANVNIGGMNMGVTIVDPEASTTTTTTTTTTSTTSGHHQQTISVPANTRGCSAAFAMNAGSFSSALASVKKQSFDETKLKTAKQIVTSNCMNVNQIMQIAQQFSFEDNKLEFAKFAFDHCTEPSQYFKLNDIFSFSSNVDALSDYIQSRQ